MKIWRWFELGFGDEYHQKSPHWQQELSALTGQTIIGSLFVVLIFLVIKFCQ